MSEIKKVSILVAVGKVTVPVEIIFNRSVPEPPSKLRISTLLAPPDAVIVSSPDPVLILLIPAESDRVSAPSPLKIVFVPPLIVICHFLCLC